MTSTNILSPTSSGFEGPAGGKDSSEPTPRIQRREMTDAQKKAARAKFKADPQRWQEYVERLRECLGYEGAVDNRHHKDPVWMPESAEPVEQYNDCVNDINPSINRQELNTNPSSMRQQLITKLRNAKDNFLSVGAFLAKPSPQPGAKVYNALPEPLVAPVGGLRFSGY
ncbi:MAG: hypothetical protein M1816_004189 [Peltula sp. TS41687]|nr:MAG: hypothetical protein M1816_004189 [Peltula sp. TS41687]